MPNQKMEAPLSVCSKKTKWQTDQVVTKLLIFEEKGGSFQIKIMLGEQNNIV